MTRRPVVPAGAAAARWTEALAGWAIPRHIEEAAPASPWAFPACLFVWRPDAERATASRTASQRVALEALGEGGSVLDVGVGGGRASLPLSPPATLVVGVDQSPELLAAFSEAAEAQGVDHRAVLGRWPDAAGSVAAEDVVVCHHVLYNVGDLVPFARALTDHARRRVVVEITAEHPMRHLNDAWRAIHGIERPTSPVAADAVAVLREMGLDVAAKTGEHAAHAGHADRAHVVAMARRRLCVGPERDAEIDALLGTEFGARLRRVVTLWWEGSAR